MSKFSELGHRLYTGEVSYDFIARRRRWYALSAVLLLISLGALRDPRARLRHRVRGRRGLPGHHARSTARPSTTCAAPWSGPGMPDLDDATINTIGSNQVRVQTRTLDPTVEVPQVRAAIGEQVGDPGRPGGLQPHRRLLGRADHRAGG